MLLFVVLCLMAMCWEREQVSRDGVGRGADVPGTIGDGHGGYRTPFNS